MCKGLDWLFTVWVLEIFLGWSNCKKMREWMETRPAFPEAFQPWLLLPPGDQVVVRKCVEFGGRQISLVFWSTVQVFLVGDSLFSIPGCSFQNCMFYIPDALGITTHTVVFPLLLFMKWPVMWMGLLWENIFSCWMNWELIWDTLLSLIKIPKK